jgi:predicted RecB family nuclease
MAPIITGDVLEGYLNCKLKGYLRLKREQGTKSDYETLMTTLKDDLRAGAYEKLLARHVGADVLRGVRIETSTLKRGAPLILDATLEDETLSLHLDGLMRVEGPSRLGGYHYVPILVVAGEKVGRDQRCLLETLGLVVGDLQAKQPAYGIVIRGRGLKIGKVRFQPGSRLPRRGLEEAKRLVAAESPPKLMLNEHCPVCEYRQRCHLQAVNEDNLSLLRGIGEKEIKTYARKGIFSVRQLAHTFRPRRKGRRVERRIYHRYHALSALAIRDKRIYVFGTPQAPSGPVAIFLDLEGRPDEGFVYLIGMVIARDGREDRHSFWADTQDQEQIIFERFLDEVEHFDAFIIYCYGGYERSFLVRMRKTTDRKDLVDRVLASLVNVLTQVYSHLYFPAYSNSLKDIARCLGFSWSDGEASGVQSIAWRMRWEATHDEQWQNKLVVYNQEDCQALKMVTEFVQAVGVGSPSGSESHSGGTSGPKSGMGA